MSRLRQSFFSRVEPKKLNFRWKGSSILILK
jgi:hypothetical protein